MVKCLNTPFNFGYFMNFHKIIVYVNSNESLSVIVLLQVELIHMAHLKSMKVYTHPMTHEFSAKHERTSMTDLKLLKYIYDTFMMNTHIRGRSRTDS